METSIRRNIKSLSSLLLLFTGLTTVNINRKTIHNDKFFALNKITIHAQEAMSGKYAILNQEQEARLDNLLDEYNNKEESNFVALDIEDPQILKDFPNIQNTLENLDYQGETITASLSKYTTDTASCLNIWHDEDRVLFFVVDKNDPTREIITIFETDVTQLKEASPSQDKVQESDRKDLIEAFRNIVNNENNRPASNVQDAPSGQEVNQNSNQVESVDSSQTDMTNESSAVSISGDNHDIHVLESKAEELEHQLSNTLNNVELPKISVAQASEEIDFEKLRQELSKAQSDLERRYTEFKKITASLDDFKYNYKYSEQTQLSIIQLENMLNDIELSLLTGNEDLTQAKHDLIQAEIAYVENKLNELEEAKQTSANPAEIEGEISQLQGKLDNLRSELAQVEEDLVQAKTAKRDSIKNKLDQAKTELTELDELLNSDSQSLESKINNLEQDKITAQAKLESAKDTLSQAEANQASDAELENLKQELEAAKNELDRIISQLELAKKVLQNPTEAEANRNQLQNKIDELNNKLLESKQDLIKTEIAYVENKLKELEAAKQTSANPAEIKREISQLQGKLDNLRNELAQVEEDLVQAKTAKRDSIQNKLDQAKTELAELDELLNSDSQSLENKINNLEQDKTTAQAKLESAKDTLSQAEANQASDAELESLRQELTVVQNELDRIISQLELAKKVLQNPTEAEANRNQLQNKVDDLTNKLSLANEDTNQQGLAQADYGKLGQNEFNENSAGVDNNSNSASVNSIQDINTNLISRVNAGFDKLKQLEEKHSQLKEQLTQANIEYENLKAINDELSQEVNPPAQEEVSSNLSQQLSQVQEQINSLEQTIAVNQNQPISTGETETAEDGQVEIVEEPVQQVNTGELQDQLSSLYSEEERLLQEKNQAEKESANVNNQAENIANEIANNEALLNEKEEEIKKLENDLAAVDAEYAQAKQDYDNNVQQESSNNQQTHAVDDNKPVNETTSDVLQSTEDGSSPQKETSSNEKPSTPVEDITGSEALSTQVISGDSILTQDSTEKIKKEDSTVGGGTTGEPGATDQSQDQSSLGEGEQLGADSGSTEGGSPAKEETSDSEKPTTSVGDATGSEESSSGDQPVSQDPEPIPGYTFNDWRLTEPDAYQFNVSSQDDIYEFRSKTR